MINRSTRWGNRYDSRKVEVLFVDLDNTLYDWLGFFGPAIRGLIYRLSELSDIPSSQLYDEFRDVFARAGNVEYSFAIENIPSLIRKHPELSGREIVEQYWPAVRVYQHRRRKYLRLYPGVRDGLLGLLKRGVRCVAVTDAPTFQAVQRLKQLKILHLLEVAAQKDHDVPPATEIVRKHDNALYGLGDSRLHDLPREVRKPQVDLLNRLMKDMDVSADQCLYVGDSLVKDISMAQKASVLDCWAAYGSRQLRTDLLTIAKVTNWDSQSVKSMTQTPELLGIYPTFVAQTFDDVVELAIRRG